MSAAAVVALVVTVGAAVISPVAARAVTTHIIHQFGPVPDGITPSSGLTADAQGNLYGVTQDGGSNGFGTVYRLIPSMTKPRTWSEEVLYSFSGVDGSQPSGSLVIGSNGIIYGTTASGGTKNRGTVYGLSQSNGVWRLTTLHSFYPFRPSQDGYSPLSGVRFGRGNLLYGITQLGGAGAQGTVFALSPTGDKVLYGIIHYFSGGTDGAYPSTLLVSQRTGDLVGTTEDGGASNSGTVFKLQPDHLGHWHEAVVYAFAGAPADLNGPFSAYALTEGGRGVLFGCSWGGPNAAAGGVFSLTPSKIERAQWREQVLYYFGTAPGDPDGTACGLTLDNRNTIYALSGLGGTGARAAGTLFTLVAPASDSGQWQEQVLKSFQTGSPDGHFPVGAPYQIGGLLFGVNTRGQHRGPGTVYEITP